MRKIRQHVNPLSGHFLAVRARAIVRPEHLPPGCPVEVELGCADADFSFALAAARPDMLVVGLDIREPCLARNRARAEELGLRNLLFGYVNLSVDLDQVFAPASVDRFHLLFPDPWLKERHQKRRVILPVAEIAAQLKPGGELHVASDIFDVALEFMAAIEDPELELAGRRFRNLLGPWSFWRDNPFAAASRREFIHSRRGERVWRMRYVLEDMPEEPD